MGDRTAIEWCDASWNPVVGCTKVSTGCKFCYAERVSTRMGQEFTKVTLHPERLGIPLHWRKPRKIFVCSMSDLFQDAVPMKFIKQVLETVLKAPEHTYQVLTKRSFRMRAILTDWYDDMKVSRPFPNLWIGVSAENQEQADKRIPDLLQTPAAVRFVSLEPILGPIDLSRYLWASGDEGEPAPRNDPTTPGVHWCIVGGESGGPPERALVHRADVALANRDVDRPWQPKPDALEWVRAIRDQCVESGTSFLHKQWGGPRPKSGGRSLDGKIWDQFPNRETV